MWHSQSRGAYKDGSHRRLESVHREAQNKTSGGWDGECHDGCSNTYASLEKDGAVASHKVIVMDDKKKVGKVLLGCILPSATPKGPSLIPTWHKSRVPLTLLNEFCYKFNRRYFEFRLFEGLELCACSYKADFKHRIYWLGRLRIFIKLFYLQYAQTLVRVTFLLWFVFLFRLVTTSGFQ